MSEVASKFWLVLCVSALVAACQSPPIHNAASNSTALTTLDAALVQESDLVGDWHWYSVSDDDGASKAEPGAETATRSLMGYWVTNENFVVLGHILHRYAGSAPALPEITSADLLDMKAAQFYSPTTTAVGLSMVVKCAQDRSAKPVAGVACRAIVRYERLISIIAVYAPVSMVDQVESVINQMLVATDGRIKRFDLGSN